MRADKILLLFVFLGVLTAAWIGYERYGIEKDFKNVQITADYQDFFHMSLDSEMEIGEYLQKMKEAGIKSAALQEETIQSLSNNPHSHIGTEMQGLDLIIEGDKKDLEFIEQGLKSTLKEERKMEWKNPNTLIIHGLPEDYIYTSVNVADTRGNKDGLSKIWEGLKLETLGLGFSEEKIQTILDSGMVPVLRPSYNHEYQDSKKTIDRYFSYIDNLPSEYKEVANIIIFAGDEFLGYDDAEYMYEKLLEHEMHIGLIESNVKGKNLKAKGQNSLTKAVHYRAVKVFTTWDYIQKRYDYEIPFHHNGEEIVNTYYRGIIDRNIRIIYLKPFLMPEGRYVTDVEAYQNLVSSLQSRLEKHSINIGTMITPLKNWAVNPIKKIPVTWAIIAAFLILLQNIFPVKRTGLYILQGFGMVFATLPFVLDKGLGTITPMWALLGTIAVASLASTFVIAVARMGFDNERTPALYRSYFSGLQVLLIAVLISVTGALFEVALLSNSEYMLDITTFKGVKVSQLMPIVIVFMIYMAYFGIGQIKEMGDRRLRLEDTWKLLNKNIKVWQVLLLGILALAGLIFMARSGNTSEVKPAATELLMRNIMENYFIARPRTKSILLGFPAVILFVALAKQKRWEGLYPILAISVAIGQSNIQNTFSHIRTPLYLSVGRVGGEFLLSIVTGGLMLLVCSKLLTIRAEKKRKKGRENG